MKPERIKRLLLLFGVACAVIVVLTHMAERLHVFPSMRWGLPDSPGHYLDLVSAVVGSTSLVTAAVLFILGRKQKGPAG